MTPTGNGEHTFQLILDRFAENDRAHERLFATLNEMRTHQDLVASAKESSLTERIDSLSDRVQEIEKTIENYKGRILVFAAAVGILGAATGRLITFALEHLHKVTP